MFNFTKALEIVLNDPAVADVRPRKKRPTSSDRLIAGFQRILAFYEANGRLPEDNPSESSLYHNLQGILKNPKRLEYCRPYDEYGILSKTNDKVEEPIVDYQQKTVKAEQLEAVLNDPVFDNFQDGLSPEIFDIPDYMKERLEARKEAEYVGKRRPCDDFDKYSDGFKEIHHGLKSGKYRLVKFRESDLKVGRYFVEQGMIGYLAAFEDEGNNKLGRTDGRTRVIYENGSEADIKFRTITKNLSVDGCSIMDCEGMSPEEFKQCFTLTGRDIESGTIYVLRSKSTRPEIASIKDLYKIGFTVTSVESRIANAKKEPTYLCADVEVVTTWKVYNVKPSTLEAIIHKLFAPVQLQLTVDGKNPKEWFIVPLRVINEAVNAIISGKSIEYSPYLQQIIYLK